jgi:hypothetical protein
MEKYLQKKAAIYTRFGDNIIISSYNRLPGVKKVVQVGLRRIGLKTNKDKEINAAEIQKSGVKVIGIVIGSRVTVSRKFRNIVRAIMHKTSAGHNIKNASVLGKIRYIQRFHPEYQKV